MKTRTKLFLIVFLIVVLMSTTIFASEVVTTSEEAPTSEVVTSENPTDETTTDETTTDEDIKNSDRFFSGDDIEISEVVDGNVFIIGKNVKLTSTQIGGDLFVIAETLSMDANSTIYGSVFVLASEITIDGAMYDTYLVCDKLNFDYNAYAQRDLRAMASEITLNGRVRRNSYLEANKLILDTDFLTAGDLNYTAQSEAVYMEKQEDDSKKETTTIPEGVVQGEVKYTKRDKKVFSKEIKKSVQDIIKTNKINSNTSEEKVKAIFTSYMFNNLGINTNSNIVKDAARSTVTIPKVVFYIGIIVIVLLVVALILPIILNKKNSKERVENKGNE